MVRQLLKIIAKDEDDRIPGVARLSLTVLARQYAAITTEIGTIEKHIHALHRSCEESRRLAEIPGVGPIVATALIAEVGDWTAFSSGRSLAAWIGLVPPPAFDRRQRQAWQDLETRQSTFAMAAGCGCHGGHPLCTPARHETVMACSPDGTQAGQGRCRRARQQNRTHGVGHDGAWRAFQRAEAAVGGIGADEERVATTSWRGHDDVMQIRSFRGSGEPAWVIALPSA